MYLHSIDIKECTGCTACAAICPENAITMVPDSHGFLCPTVNKKTCIGCKLCEKVCPEKSTGLLMNTYIKAYAIQHKSEEVRHRSRSGGAYFLLASKILEKNGVVWGAVISDNLEVIHKKAENIDELRLQQGSKYVQSRLSNAFCQIENDLRQDRYVMFSGTACQVAGLKNYLTTRKCDQSKLFSCDLVCQGVPSPLLYKEFLCYLEKKHQKKVSSFDFRDKTRLGWGAHEESYVLKNEGKKHYSRRYASLFYSHLALRESCFHCRYTNFNRPADFTLADFWNDKKYAEFCDEIGNSMVIINTDKGQKFFDNILDECNYIELNKEDCIQPRLCSSCEKPNNYEAFWSEWATKGADYCIKKYGKESLESLLVYTFKPILKW